MEEQKSSEALDKLLNTTAEQPAGPSKWQKFIKLWLKKHSSATR